MTAVRRSIVVALALAPVLGIASCDDGGRDKETGAVNALPESAVVKAGPPPVVDSVLRRRLREISPEITADTFVVTSGGDDGEADPMHGAAVGPELEHSFAALYGNAFANGPNVYAVGWFRMEGASEVFLLRTPSQYDVSAMTLWVIDTLAPDWSRSFEAADGFGDAGWSFEKQGWIIRSGAGRDRKVVVRRIDSDEDIESDTMKPRKIGPDSLYEVSLRAWLAKDTSVRVLPASLKPRFRIPGQP